MNNDIILISKLRDFGCDTEGAVKRVMGNAGLYARLVREYTESIDINGLSELVLAGKCRPAFEAAHAIKGVCVNLGFTPLYTTISEAVEILRGGSLDGVAPIVARFAEQKKQMTDIIDSCQ